MKRILSCGGDDTLQGGSSGYARLVTRMLFDEPSVQWAVSTLQDHSLRHGVRLRWGDTPPTPLFERHVREHYEPFCRQAIQLFVAVGFAPYRLRRQGTHLVPEALPLGTFTWSVTRTPKQKKGGGAATSEPLLRYEVLSTHCDDPIHVWPYVLPHSLFVCYSPLATLISQYSGLVAQRERAGRAEEWNCRPNVVFEEQDKALINDMANTGACIQTAHHSLYAGLESSNRLARQETILDSVESVKERVNLPEDATVLIAPKNNTAKGMEKAEPPSEMQKRELFFARSVALVLGLPPSWALQGTAGLASSGGGGGSGAWNESPEVTGRALQDAVGRVHRALQGLMTQAYELIYGADFEGVARRMPTFDFQTPPTLPYEQLLPLYDAQLLDDRAYGRLFRDALGAPLNQPEAGRARYERHRAVNILPFKDKKDAPT